MPDMDEFIASFTKPAALPDIANTPLSNSFPSQQYSVADPQPSTTFATTVPKMDAPIRKETSYNDSNLNLNIFNDNQSPVAAKNAIPVLQPPKQSNVMIPPPPKQIVQTQQQFQPQSSMLTPASSSTLEAQIAETQRQIQMLSSSLNSAPPQSMHQQQHQPNQLGMGGVNYMQNTPAAATMGIGLSPMGGGSSGNYIGNNYAQYNPNSMHQSGNVNSQQMMGSFQNQMYLPNGMVLQQQVPSQFYNQQQSNTLPYTSAIPQQTPVWTQQQAPLQGNMNKPSSGDPFDFLK